MADDSTGSANDTARVKEIFTAALEQPEALRGAFLDGACDDDAVLRREVEALLAAHFGRPVLVTPVMPNGTTETAPLTEGPGTRIGPYKLLQQIGEGGFGVVFMADQETPVRRRVALKIIKLGMDTRRVVARFEAERQALAMMDHPHIARVLDAGATDSGRPYFVMELVKGDPVTEYCDRNNLSIPERLELFTQICNAVQHAHTKGIIHRDIKPSNVLVSTQDGRPHAKVIDFGIAKATDHRLTEKTLFTEHKALIGTPAYMSPEQAEGSLDIDTRTDVYSLGVLMYELLTGTTPFDNRQLREAAYAEMQRIIRETEPQKPSTRISSLGGTGVSPVTKSPLPAGAGPIPSPWQGEGQGGVERAGQGQSRRKPTLADLARHRSTEPKKLGLLVRGELDWIVMKALDKDRARRYETASAFAADVQRHLSGEPVVAAPPSAAYRVRKFVRKHRGRVAAALAVFATLFAGIVGTTAGLVRAERQRRIAYANEQKAQDAERLAKVQADVALAINEFLNNDLLAAVAPWSDPTKGVDVKMRDVLEEASKRIDEAALPGGRFADKTLVQASIRDTLARTFIKLGLHSRAEPHAARAVELRRARLGQEQSETLASVNILAMAYTRQGKFVDAQRLYEQTLEIQRRVLGPEHPETLKLMNTLSEVYSLQRKYDAAQQSCEQALEIQRRILGPEHPDTMGTIINLAHNYFRQRKHPAAQRLYEQALELGRRTLGPEHRDTLQSMTCLAQIYVAQGRHADAEKLYEDSLATQFRVLGPDHAQTQESRHELAYLYHLQGKYAQVQNLYEQMLETSRHVLGSDHPETIRIRGMLIEACAKQNRRDVARPLIDEQIRVGRKAADASDAHPLVLNLIAMLLLTAEPVELRDPAAALAYAKRAVQKTGSKVDDYMDTLALAYHLTGDYQKAVETEEKAITLLPPGNSPARAEFVANLARFRRAAASQSTSAPSSPSAMSEPAASQPGTSQPAGSQSEP